MDPRWEQPTLTTQSTIDNISDVAIRMDAVDTMFTDVYMFMLQEGTGEEAVEVLRKSLRDIHNTERSQQLGEEPYNEEIIRTVHTAAVVFTELGEFLKNATLCFVIDYEVEHGGES